MRKKKKEQIEKDNEELYWEWIIALENGDTNMSFDMWKVSHVIQDSLSKIYNYTPIEDENERNNNGRS